MAISNDKITNRLDKKINFGVATTAKDSVVAPSGEVLSSPLFSKKFLKVLLEYKQVMYLKSLTKL